MRHGCCETSIVMSPIGMDTLAKVIVVMRINLSRSIRCWCLGMFIEGILEEWRNKRRAKVRGAVVNVRDN